MGHHLVHGEFKSDKYPWCKTGFVPLKLTDVDAQVALKPYAKFHRYRDPEFSDDLEEAIRIQEGKSQSTGDVNEGWGLVARARQAISAQATKAGNCPVCGGGIGDNHYDSCPVNLLDRALELNPKKLDAQNG